MPYRCWNQELIVSHMLNRRTSYTKNNWLINYLLQCVWRMTDARMLPPWLHRWSSIHTPSCTVVIFVVLAVFTFINGKMELHFFTGSERSQASTHFPTFHIYWPTCEHGEKKLSLLLNQNVNMKKTNCPSSCTIKVQSKYERKEILHEGHLGKQSCCLVRCVRLVTVTRIWTIDGLYIRKGMGPIAIKLV